MTTIPVAEWTLLDTNVLVYAFDGQSAFHAPSRALLMKAAQANPEERYCVTPQILAEFFAVVTSPRRTQNPRTSQESLDILERLTALPGLTVLPTPVDVVSRWISLSRTREVRGSGVFDAQLVATMLGNGVRKICTFNRSHFEHYRELEVLTPQ